MIKNNVYYELFASIQVPNHEEVGYWIDLGADPHGNIIKFFDKTINRWVKLTDASSEYATPPYIGSNGNWFIENRDSGVPAVGKNPYIGEDNYWFVFVPSENKYVNTGIMAKGLSAYELAVKHGFKGTEEEWLEYLRKPALDAAVDALEAADKANEATEDAKVATAKADIAAENAQNAADRSNEIADNPPKIVNEEWYMYDELTKEYKPTGIKAIGDPFEIKKTYKSIADMEADYDNPMIGVGQFVWINTGNVEDPDDSKLFLKGTDGWILVGDLSGNQGIQGLSAYEVAVENGYVGTEEDWIQSLKQPSLDAAAEALEAKAQVEATEAAVKAAEALRVTAEEGRVTAETTRESNEATRKTNESGRVTAENARVVAENARASAENARAANEDTRKSNESTRITQENTRQTNESTRINSEAGRVASETARETAEATRVTQEQGRVDAEAIRVANENARNDAETDRSDAEDIRIANEADRVAKEAIRETQETERQTNTAEAITAVNEAKTAAQAATTNANTAAYNANTQANRAKEYSDNPPKIENDRWWVWDEVNDTYVNTEVFATGEPGKSPIIQDGTWWVYNNETSEYQDTLIPVTVPYQLTKEKVEAVLTGEIKSHHHDGFYYTEYEIDQKLTKVNAIVDTKIDKSSAGVANGIAQLDLTGKVPASQLPSFVDDVLEFDSVTAFPEEGEAGKIYIAVDTNITYRWSGTQYTTISSSLALGETSSTAYPGDKGKANADKLATIESGAQVNVIENVKARGTDLPITDKRVIVPEDIAIGDTEPTGDELVWFNTSEDYLFEFDGYTKLALGETSSTAYPGDKGKANADKLATIESGAQVNVIENVKARGTDLPITDKRVIVPEDIAIGDTEPTGDELVWFNTSEDYLFEFDGYTKEEADNKFVAQKNKSWIEANMESTMAYWYENNENQSTTVLNTGGNRNVIESLRSKFKRCIAKPYGEDAALISFCNETNSKVWPDRSQITIDGERKENRMTYFPKYYHKTVEMSSGVWRTYISEMQLDDDYIEEPEMLLSTFEAFNNNGVLYSGSEIISTGSQTIATFVTQAKANGPLWGIGDYRSHATIARMFCAYYGNTNISTSNSSIPCSGGTKRYDGGKTGGTLSLGNVDGKVPVNGDTGYYSTNFLGLEDCYYSKWEFVQGANAISGKWIVYDGGSFPDKDVADLEAAGATNIRIAGNAVYDASTNGSGWTKKMSHGRYGDVVPTEIGGSDSTYYTDCYWFDTGNRIVLRSGHSADGSRCGVFVAHARHSSSSSWTGVGSRLAFYGKIVVVDSDDFKKTQN